MRRLTLAGGVVLGVGLVLTSGPAFAVITRLTPLREILANEQLIFVAKVESMDPDRPAAILQVDETLKGKVPFTRLPVNLTGDSEGKKKNDPAALLKRLAPGLPVVVCGSLNDEGTRYTAFGYTNGTWFQLIGYVDKANAATVRWAFTHCEPYLRRTFKGSTEELRQVLRDGLAGKKPPPDPDSKEKPGLGPEIKSAEPGKRKTDGASLDPSTTHTRGPLLAVIPTVALLGPLALLAALFPAVFGGLMLVFKRWLVLLSVASLNSTLYLVYSWQEGFFRAFWWGTPLGLWVVLTLVTLAGAVWSWRRYRRTEALPLRALEKGVLWTLSILGLGVVAVGALRGVLLTSPWKELLTVWVVAWTGTLSLLVVRLTANRKVVPTEGIMLGALAFACAGLGATTLPRKPANITVAWVFIPDKPGMIYSSPLPAGDRVYVAAALAPRPTQVFGTLFCLDRATGQPLWRFTNDGEMKQVSISSPCLVDGRLYIGEGFHEDSDCRLYCLDAGTGEKLWEFQTTSHTESSPRVAGGRVYFGAGDDGLFCLDAKTGRPLWHFENVHVDTTPAVVGNRVYAGTGYGDAFEAFCLDAGTGQPRWRTRVDLPVWGSPVVAAECVYVGLGNGTFTESNDQPAGALLCLSADTGEVRWRYDVPDAVLMRPAVDVGRGRLFFGARDRHCYGLDLEGRLRWKQDVGSAVVAAPALVGDRLYVAASAGRLCCLGAEAGEVRWSFDVTAHAQKSPQLFSSPAAGEDGVYFGAGLENVLSQVKTGALYFLKEE